MSYSGAAKNAALNLADAASDAKSYLFGEVNGGMWCDEVGESYLSFAENIYKTAGGFKDSADSLSSLERAIESIDESADQKALAALKAEVAR